jgi:SOS response regulatory protein OraA/RecX
MMTEPKNGDFAAWINDQAKQTKPTRPVQTEDEDERIEEEIASAVMSPEEEEAAWQEVVEELAKSQADLAANPLTDEELERQALEAGGADNDPGTPE